jgi:hypothetical protein
MYISDEMIVEIFSAKIFKYNIHFSPVHTCWFQSGQAQRRFDALLYMWNGHDMNTEVAEQLFALICDVYTHEC